MSGVEIVGLVLGVLPILIEAAKHVHERSKGKRASKESNFACGFRNRLVTQQALLSLYIKGVVGRTSLPPATQRELVSHPACQTWRKKEVVQALKSQLGEAYSLFEEILSRLCKTLAKHVETTESRGKLPEDQIVGPQSPCRFARGSLPESEKVADTPADRQKLWSRIKFRWSSAERHQILLELEQCNKLLRQLSSAVDCAKPYERSQESRRAHAAFKTREGVEHIFGVLRKTCDCDLPYNHVMGLRLQRPPLVDDGSLQSKFVILLLDSEQTICKVYARMEKSQVTVPPKKKICFSSSKDIPVGPTFELRSKNMVILKGICQAAKLAQTKNSVLEVIVDPESDAIYSSQARDVPPVAPTEQQQQNQQLVNLTEAMNKLSVYCRKRWLNKDKLILAITLAYSLLQLHKSRWLEAQWNSNSISFVEDCGPCAAAEDVHQLRRPFTRSQATAVAAAYANTATTSTSYLHADLHAITYLNALGVILLELFLNRSIETDDMASNANNLCYTAQDLLMKHSDDDNMSPDYFRAVHFCLAPRPSDNMSYRFEDEGFRELYYTEVIRSLEEDAKSKFELQESDWGNDEEG
ncbi:hypothetical protein LTS15_005708 [Exophiala xenobiotica]|nr:hypothetical protein LTS15_005708 [Exophiala xenobiotica]